MDSRAFEGGAIVIFRLAPQVPPLYVYSYVFEILSLGQEFQGFDYCRTITVTISRSLGLLRNL